MLSVCTCDHMYVTSQRIMLLRNVISSWMPKCGKSFRDLGSHGGVFPGTAPSSLPLSRSGIESHISIRKKRVCVRDVIL